MRSVFCHLLDSRASARYSGGGMHARALGITLLAVAACAGPSTTTSPPPRPAPFDLIVRGGSVLDGPGRPAYRADVGVAAGRITRLGELSRDTAATEIDASGLVVTPGFINITATRRRCRRRGTS